MLVFRTLKQLDHAEGLERAREQFLKDLSAGELSSSYLLSEIGDILELLEVDWPSDAVLEAMSDYLEQVLAANQGVRPYKSLTGSAPSWSVEQTLCRFVAELLAFPVVDIGVAARCALAKYVSTTPKGLLTLLTGQPWWDPIQLEHLLAIVHVAVVSGSPCISDIRAFVESLNHSESLAVRSVAKRICAQCSWNWMDVTTAPPQPVILLPGDPTPLREAGMVLDGDAETGWNLHQELIQPLMSGGLDEDELHAEFKRVYWTLKGTYLWENDQRLKRWMSQLSARFWLNSRAIIGREAAMRVFGRRTLTGQVSPGSEVAYDRFYPIYDPQIELHQPTERPVEFESMAWHLTSDEREAWLQGAAAGDWSHYPDLVQGQSLIGERTWFVRPEWEWPREERYRGLIAQSYGVAEKRAIESTSELTYEGYLAGLGQDDRQLIVLNDERQLVGPAYRWAAINSNFARDLGWHPSSDAPFRWLDASGNVMVESTHWRDGWIGIEPPRLESLGEGWFVSASPAAIEAIRQLASGTEIHLWVERRSHGNRPYKGSWHLSRPL